MSEGQVRPGSLLGAHSEVLVGLNSEGIASSSTIVTIWSQKKQASDE